MHLPTGYTNLTSLKTRSFSNVPENSLRAQAEDDDVLSDYDVISSRTVSRQGSQESIEDEDEMDEKGTKGESTWGLNRAICETDSFCAKKTLCTFNFSILRDQSDVILRLIDSSGRCGRLRVNPIGGWLTKWSITAVARRRGYRGGWAVGDEGVEDDDYDDEESKRGEVDGYDLTDECGVPSVFRSNQYQDAPGVAMNEEFRFAPRTMPEEFHISCRVLELSSAARRDRGAAEIGCNGRVNGDHECPLLGSGQTIVKISSLSIGGTLKMNIFAQPEVSESSILISLNYLPLAERLCVVIMKVKDLKLRDGEQTPQSVYVKVELYRKEQRLKKKKTSTKYNTCNPVFNDMLGFDLMREHLKDAKLKILVVQRLKQSTQHSEHSQEPNSFTIKNNQGKTYDYYVFGMCWFGGKKCSPSERDHYDQMLKSPRVPVAKWHLLKMTTF